VPSKNIVFFQKLKIFCIDLYHNEILKQNETVVNICFEFLEIKIITVFEKQLFSILTKEIISVNK